MLEKQRCVLARIVVFVCPWREIQWERLMRAVSGVGIWPSEVKFLDRPKTIISESIRQVHSFSIKNESRGIEDDQIPS